MECRERFTCSGPLGGVHTCRDIGHEGATCTSALACADGLFCDASGTCARRRVAGERCGLVTDFGLHPFIRECANGFLCVPDGTARACVWARDATEGDACVYAFDSCPDPFVCLGIDGSSEAFGRCASRVAAGAACDNVTPCAFGHRCVGGRCVPIVELDEACDAEHVCPMLHACFGGRCEPLPLDGEACVWSDGRCRRGVCDGEVCRLLPAGSACSGFADCEGQCTPDGCAGPLAAGEACGLVHACPARHLCRLDDAFVEHGLPDCRFGW